LLFAFVFGDLFGIGGGNVGYFGVEAFVWWWRHDAELGAWRSTYCNVRGLLRGGERGVTSVEVAVFPAFDVARDGFDIVGADGKEQRLRLPAHLGAIPTDAHGFEVVELGERAAVATAAEGDQRK
jgi:hypothetical protein